MRLLPPLRPPRRRRALFPRRARPTPLELASRDLVLAQHAVPFDPDEFALMLLMYRGTLACTVRACRRRGRP